MSEVEVECVGCGAAVRRPAAVARMQSWRSSVRCDTCAAAEDCRAQEALAGRTARRNLARFRARVEKFDARAGYGDAAVTDFDSAPLTTAITTVIAGYRQAGPNQPSRHGAVLIGPAGIGKTRAMFAILNSLADQARRIEFGLEDEILGASRPSWELAGHIADRVGHADVIGIDDVGVSVRRPEDRLYAWKQFADVVARAQHPVVVVVTTNLRGWRPLEEWMGAQAASRLSSWMPLATPGFLDYRTNRVHTLWRADLERAQDQAGAER